MWTTVITQCIDNGCAFVSSFTPKSVQLDARKTYSVTVTDYLDSKFSRCEGGSTDRTGVLTTDEDKEITAFCGILAYG